MNQNTSPIDRLIAPTPLGVLAATCAGAAGWGAIKLPDVIEAASRGWRRHTGASAVLVAQPALAVVALIVAALVLWRIRSMMMSGGDGYDEPEPRRREYDEPQRREYRERPPQRPQEQRYDDTPLDEWGDDPDLPDEAQPVGHGRVQDNDLEPPRHPRNPAAQPRGRDPYSSYDDLLDGE